MLALAPTLTLAMLWQGNERVITLPSSTSAKPKASVTGTVVSDSTEIPLSGATVSLTRHYENIVAMLAEEGTFPAITPARTDASGRFLFSAIDAAAYDLTVKMRGYVTTAKSFTAMPGQRLDGFSVTMVRAATISGQTRNSIGKPLAGTPVGLFWRGAGGIVSVIETKSSSDGSYQLADFLPGNYFLMAGTPSGANGEQLGSFARSMMVSAGTIKLDISIDPKARQSLRGSLRVVAGSIPAESQLRWTLTVTEAGGKMVTVPAPRVQYNSQTGDFVVSDLSPGFYRFEAANSVGMCGQVEALLSQADINALQIALRECK